LQGAENHVSAGATVKLAGTSILVSEVDISQSITLTGEGTESTTLRVAEPGITNSRVFNINAPGSTINISNIVLELDFNHIKLICDPSNMEIIMDDPGILKNTYIDIVIDWLTFYISSGNMGVQLSLSQITAPNLCIHNASPKIIPPDQVPELYKTISSFNITFDIKDKDMDLDSDHAHEI